MGSVSVRDVHEATLTRMLGRLFADQKRAILDLVKLVGRVDFSDSFWQEQKLEMVKDLRPLFMTIFLDYAGTVTPAKAPIGDPADFVNIEALDWAMTYAPHLVDELIRVNWEVIRKQLVRLTVDGDYLIKDFADDIEYLFGPQRATTIAVTETTRAYSQATRAIQKQYAEWGTPMIEQWRTARDEKVCAVCGPLHNEFYGEGWWEPPPAHPNCRCSTVLRLRND